MFYILKIVHVSVRKIKIGYIGDWRLFIFLNILLGVHWGDLCNPAGLHFLYSELSRLGGSWEGVCLQAWGQLSTSAIPLDQTEGTPWLRFLVTPSDWVVYFQIDSLTDYYYTICLCGSDSNNSTFITCFGLFLRFVLLFRKREAECQAITVRKEQQDELTENQEDVWHVGMKCSRCIHLQHVVEQQTDLSQNNHTNHL